MRTAGASAGKYLDALEAEGWHYTVSYNKWTGPLERTAKEQPASAWKQNGEDQHAFLRHQPEGCATAHRFAAVKWKEDLFERYGLIACDQQQTDAGLTGERHRFKGGKEQLFNEVLNGMDLHRPPCSALRANEIYYLIAALAYNLMAAVKLVDLNDDCQGWRVKTVMKKLVFLPGRLTRRARQWIAKVLLPGGWMSWWQQNAWPQEHQVGRPRLSAASG